MKIIENIKKRIFDWKIKKLSKVAVVFENNSERQYIEPGPKTYGRLNMFKTLHLVLRKIYGDEYEKKLTIYGIRFDENENEINVTISLNRPGMLIGKMGKDLESLETDLSTVFKKQTKIKIEELPKIFGLNYINIL